VANTGVGQALAVARRIGGDTGAGLADAARAAFIDGMRVSLWVAASLLLLGAVAVNRAFPSHVEPQQQLPVPPLDAEMDGPEPELQTAVEVEA
jgi:hypothetical protein